MKMKINKLTLIFAVIPFLFAGCGESKEKKESYDIPVTNGNLKATIVTSGSVVPQNRLEIKPTISGRLEELLVKEGDKVKEGQIIAWMSSSDRAAILDAARGMGESELKYWKEAYKPIPITAPIDGDVIVRSLEPGQSVSPSAAIVVLSDKLIVKARVDETDIGHVKTGMTARITLDAYPEVDIASVITHISYESKVANNVTIYEVDVLPQSIPEIVRSGMNTEVKIVYEEHDNVPVIPWVAVSKEGKDNYVSIKGGEKKKKIEIGFTDSKYVEVKKGLKAGDVVVAERTIVKGDSAKKQTNPFMPFNNNRNRASQGRGH